MKLIGGLLIIIGTTVVGFLLAKKLSDRPKQLRQLKVALQAMEAEITYGLTPILTVSDHLMTQIPKPIGMLFEILGAKLRNGSTSLQESWEQSLAEFWPQTALKKGEIEVLQQFGTTLGRHDRKNQQKQIHLALTHLEREEIEARENQRKYEGMIKSLGFLTGLLIVLLLI